VARAIPTSPARATTRRLIVFAAMALGGFALSCIPARSDPSGLDVDLFQAGTRLPDWLDLPLRAVMQLGTIGAVLVVAVGVLLFTRRWQLPLALLAAGMLARWGAELAKAGFERARPTEALTGVDPRDTAGGFGFASGHTSVAFAFAAVVSWWLPRRWRPLAWTLAAAVGLARVYVGVHYPLDVLGGAALGTALGTAVVAVVGVPRPVSGIASSVGERGAGSERRGDATD